MVALAVIKLFLRLMRAHLFASVLSFFTLEGGAEKISAVTYVKGCSAYVFLWVFYSIKLHLDLEFILSLCVCVYVCVRLECSNFILLHVAV